MFADPPDTFLPVERWATQVLRWTISDFFAEGFASGEIFAKKGSGPLGPEPALSPKIQQLT